MEMESSEDLAVIKRELSYNPETGHITSINSRGPISAGSIVGTDNSGGYLQIMLKGRRYSAHRIAFALSYGFMPMIVDHINGNPSDNRLCNLRAADNVKNGQNTKPRVKSSSRFKGVSPSEYGTWQVHIKAEPRKNKWIGRFRSEIEAAFMYDIASLKYHGEFGQRNFLPLVSS